MADLPSNIDQAAVDRAEINAAAGSAGEEEPTAEIAAMRTDIEHTRTDIEETLEAIKEKLNPQVMLEQAKEHVKDAAVDAIDHAKDAMKDGVSTTVENVKESVGGAMHSAADAVGNAVHNVTDSVSNAVQSAKDKVGDIFGGSKDKASEVVSTTKDTLSSTAQTVSGKLGGVMEGAKGAGTTVVDTVKRNPMPTALIAVGATYLYLKHRDDNKVPRYATRDYDYSDYDPLFPTSQPGSRTTDEDIIIVEPGVDGQTRHAGGYNYDGRSSGSTGASSLLDTVSSNPVPIAVAILGATWMFMRNRSGSDPGSASYRRDDYVDYLPTDDMTNHGSKIGDVVDTVKDKASHVGDAVSDAVGSAKDKVGDAVSGAKDKVGDAVGSAKEKVGDVMDSAKDKVSGALDTAKDKAGQAASAVGSAVSTAKDKAVQVTGQARQTVSNLGSSAMEQTRRAGGAVSDTFHDNPMAYGLVALGIGAAVGLLIPATEPENRLMGQKRDELFNKAQSTASDIAHKVQAVAGETLDAAKTTAMQEAKNQGLANE